MPTAGSVTPPSTSAPAVLVLDLDGGLCVGDLFEQAFARHAAARLDDEHGRRLIGAVRGHLEGRRGMRPADIDCSTAENGREVVQVLARALGATDPALDVALRAARSDQVRLGFAVDVAPTLPDALDALPAGTHVAVCSELAPEEACSLLHDLDLTRWVHEVVAGADPAAAVDRLLDRREDPRRMLVISDRWAPLARASALGANTALVDRFARGRGFPSFRAPTLDDMVPAITTWAVAAHAQLRAAEGRRTPIGPAPRR